VPSAPDALRLSEIRLQPVDWAAVAANFDAAAEIVGRVLVEGR
jgi:hypothetical protein